MTFSKLLLEKAGPIRTRISRHPFVRGIADGSLQAEKFSFYLGQDYIFLVEYCRILALAVAKGTDLPTMARFAELLSATLNVEMGLHREYAEQFGLARSELERTPPVPTTHAYTRHLLNVAWSAGQGEIAASLLPCQWGYWELGSELAKEGATAVSNPYRRWVESYSAPEFGELAGWLRGLVDSTAEGAREPDLARMEREFMASSRYELAFWEMAWSKQGWPA